MVFNLQDINMRNMLKLFITDLKRFTVLLMGVNILGLAGMLMLEHFFGFRPCFLCKVQRYLTLAIIVTCVIGYSSAHILRKDSSLTYTLMAVTVILIGMTALGIYQVMVEKGIVEMSSFCQDSTLFLTDADELLEAMESGSAPPPCNKPQILFGISVAVWTMLALLAIDAMMICHFIMRRKDLA